MDLKIRPRKQGLLQKKKKKMENYHQVFESDQWQFNVIVIKWDALFSWAQKSLQMVTEAMKLKNPCSLEEKLMINLVSQFSSSVMSDSLRPYGPQHIRLPCLSSTPGACSKSCPSSQWCHPTTLSSVIPFSSCLQSFPASGSFPVSQFLASGGQSIGTSVSASVLPMNI